MFACVCGWLRKKHQRAGKMNKSDYALSKQDILCTYRTYQTLMPTEKEKKNL